ncbi:MAG: DUF3108 domain-containing protein [Paracoccaceae bacterium]|nr:DUF3108 domain-containing protein [Paracoccaceae bacterium]
MPKRSPTIRRLCLGACISVAMTLGGGASEAQDRGVFDIYLGALKVGVFAFSGIEDRGRYSTAGQLRSTGFIGALADVRYDAKSRGSVRNGEYIPEVYEESANIGARSTDLVISYKNGVPEPPRFDPPRQSNRPPLNPAAQGDTIDLMTMLYTLLKDVPAAEVCRYDALAYDGVRRTQVTMRVETRSADIVTCAAEYRRIAGFSAAELRDRPVFPFRLVYAAREDGDFRAVAVDLETVYGVVRLERRPQT